MKKMRIKQIMKMLFFLLGMLISGVAYGQKNNVLEELQKITDSTTLKVKVASLERGSEDDLNILVAYYRSKRDDNKMNAAIALGALRFPQGNLAFRAAQDAISEEKDASKRKSKFIETKNIFPTLLEQIEFQRLAAKIVLKSIEEKSIDDALFYTQSIKDPSIFSMIAYFIYVFDKNQGEELFRNYINTSSPQTDISSVLAGYSHILIGNGKLQEASDYAKKAYAKSKDNKEFLMDYAKILKAEGNRQELVKVLEEMVINGFGSADIQDSLIDAYRKSGVDANAMMKKLNAKQEEKKREAVVKKMINEPAPMFTIKDVNGKDVKLADFKGKTIVVDFWATWCGPCKASFPTMQKVVDRYKDDKNVRFLFVHTWERGIAKPLEIAKKYLNDNKYTFDLFIDYANPETKVNPTISAFGVEGIPTKFVIDGNGIIRFKSLGFSGREKEDIEEISAMIEIARSEAAK